MRKVRSGLIFVIAFVAGALVDMTALIVFLAIVVPVWPPDWKGAR
jgi:hypothetical protein